MRAASVRARRCQLQPMPVGNNEPRDLQCDAVLCKPSSCPVRLNYEFHLRSLKHFGWRSCIGDWREFHQRCQRELLPVSQSDVAKVVFIDWADKEESYNLMYNACSNLNGNKRTGVLYDASLTATLLIGGTSCSARLCQLVGTGFRLLPLSRPVFEMPFFCRRAFN